MFETEKKAEQNQQETIYSLNDDRRVKTLSPGAMITKRFFWNRIVVFGILTLIVMSLLSFAGGVVSPYGESELFYRMDKQTQKYVGVKVNTKFRHQQAEKNIFPAPTQAQFMLAKSRGTLDSATDNVQYSYEEVGKDLYVIYKEGASEPIVFTSLVTVAPVSGDEALPSDMQFTILKVATNQETPFTLGSDTYTIDGDGTVPKDDQSYTYASRHVISVIMSGVTFSKQLKEELIAEIEAGKKEFIFRDVGGTGASYTFGYDVPSEAYSIMQVKKQCVYDIYSSPSEAHLLSIDKDGMDMLIRLMYGGRVSLYIDSIVVIIETVIGTIMGGISGCFGGWVDILITRIVDIFYRIPNTPTYIVIGAAMDALRVDPQICIIYLTMIPGFLGQLSITRPVRGQVLMLCEQEFMTAAEATSIKPINRILRHLLPNVIPQLTVTCAISLGGVTPIGAALFFLSLDVKFPLTSWENIINDVSNTHVPSDYLFIWIPAGIYLLLMVLVFNLVGDGFRDIFDLKMRRRP